MGKKLTTILLISFTVSCIIVTGCKKDEVTVNGHKITMTAKLDGHDWSTSEVYANNNSNYLNIVGSNPLKGTITFTLDGFSESTFELGNNIHTFGTYTNKDQITYFTNPYGSGQVTITSIDTDNKIITGTFNFIAKSISGNSITATDGSFTSQYD